MEEKNKYIDKEGKIILDTTLQTVEDRNQYITDLVKNVPADLLTPRMLTIMGDYILDKISKKERKEKKILTKNHAYWVNKRETSFEGLANKFENGENGIYGLIANDKNIIFMPKIEITQEDIDSIPALKLQMEAIAKVEEQYKNATGKRKGKLKADLIEMHKEKLTIRNAFKKPIYFQNVTKGFNRVDLDEKIEIDEKGNINVEGFTLLKPECVFALLTHYSALKEDTYAKFDSDGYYMLIDLEDLIDSFLEEENPIYFEIMVNKIDKRTNNEIAQIIHQKFGKIYSEPYISTIWTKKIPERIAFEAQKRYLEWYFTERKKGYWKKCSCCGQIKLGHTFFFTKNNTSKDGWYSICKECRREKNKAKKK